MSVFPADIISVVTTNIIAPLSVMSSELANRTAWRVELIRHESITWLFVSSCFRCLRIPEIDSTRAGELAFKQSLTRCNNSPDEVVMFFPTYAICNLTVISVILFFCLSVCLSVCDKPLP